MNKLDRLETFFQVASEGSFAKAARRLDVSTAAVSKKIALFEKELGVELIKRSTRSFALTTWGELYFDHCKTIIAQIKEGEDLVAFSRSEPSGILRVTAGRYFSERYIIPNLAEFVQLFPKVRLELELAERMPDLEKENIDILIGMSMSGASDCIQKKIARTRYVLCASPSYLAKHGTPQSPDDLVGHSYISHSMRSPDLISFKTGKKIRLEPLLRLNDTQAMLHCALAGMGIVKLHDYAVEEAVAQGELVEILEEYRDDALPIYVCYLQRKYVAPKIRCFIDFILAKLNHESKK
jgi:DNA-binding transcriptional LysR family regulator